VDSLLSQRELTPAQAARLERLRAAAWELASEGGYAAVTMRSVAERAQVGLATVYRYFSSKDHLIADVHALRSQRVLAELRAAPPRGRTPATRLAAVFDRMLDVTAEDLKLAAAGVAALTSSDAVASAPGYWKDTVMSSYVDTALGEEEVADREALGELFGHLFFSLMVGLSTGRLDLAECKAVMRRSLALVFPQEKPRA